MEVNKIYELVGDISINGANDDNVNSLIDTTINQYFYDNNLKLSKLIDKALLKSINAKNDCLLKIPISVCDRYEIRLNVARRMYEEYFQSLVLPFIRNELKNKGYYSDRAGIISIKNKELFLINPDEYKDILKITNDSTDNIYVRKNDFNELLSEKKKSKVFGNIIDTLFSFYDTKDDVYKKVK